MAFSRRLSGVENLEDRVLLSTSRTSTRVPITRAPVDPRAPKPPEFVAAFPGAEGFGATSVGGRGGDVYQVSNLNDSGPGSLRHGIESATGPRTIVFGVSGNIELHSRLRVDSSFLTIAGQTAPGDGITLRNYGVMIIDANDVIMRYVRLRPGDAIPGEHDSLLIYNAENVMIDHVSASWSVDENVDIVGSTNVSIQWSIISEGLNDSNHRKGEHSAGSRSDSSNVTYHHNLYAHNDIRNPLVRQDADIVNNVFYNYGHLGTFVGWNGSSEDVHGETNVNLQNNYYISGASTVPFREFRGQDGSTIWVSGNLSDSNQNGVLDGSSLTFFLGSEQTPVRFDYPVVSVESAIAAVESVLAGAGASRLRDLVDQRIVNDVIHQSGEIIDSQEDVGGYPELQSQPALRDSDRDGMPDSWENARRHLNARNANDRNRDHNYDGYTNLEEYLNHLASEVSLQEAPLSVELAPSPAAAEPVTSPADSPTNPPAEPAPSEPVELPTPPPLSIDPLPEPSDPAPAEPVEPPPPTQPVSRVVISRGRR